MTGTDHAAAVKPTPAAAAALARLAEVQQTYPVRAVEVLGRVWHYRVTGDTASTARPALFLPGIQGGGDAFYEVAYSLGAAHRLVLPSAPDITDPDEMVTTTAAFLDVLGLARVHVLGSSLGGYLAQAFAVAFPGRVDELILANTFYDASPFLATIPPAATIEQADAADLVAQNLRSLGGQSDADDGIERLVAIMTRLVGGEQPVENYKSRMVLLARTRPVARPPIEDSRITVIDDDRDPMVPPAMRAAVRRRFAGADQHAIDGGGHLPAIQRPQAFNALIRPRLR
jgi:maspardin